MTDRGKFSRYSYIAIPSEQPSVCLACDTGYLADVTATLNAVVMLTLQLIKEMQSAPTEIDLMKDTIYVLTNSSAPTEEVLLALEALQSLVEPIDNANGRHTCHMHTHCSCGLSGMLALSLQSDPDACRAAIEMHSAHAPPFRLCMLQCTDAYQCPM